MCAIEMHNTKMRRGASAASSHRFILLLFCPLEQEQLPDLWSHFQELNLEAHMYASQWFLTLFTAKFPLCMVFHITDLLLCEVQLSTLTKRETQCGLHCPKFCEVIECDGYGQKETE